MVETTYTPAEFLAALADHVSDRYRHNIRYFGLLAPRVKSHTHDAVFALLGQLRLGKPRRLRWAASHKRRVSESILSWTATASGCIGFVGYHRYQPGAMGSGSRHCRRGSAPLARRSRTAHCTLRANLPSSLRPISRQRFDTPPLLPRGSHAPLQVLLTAVRGVALPGANGETQITAAPPLSHAGRSQLIRSRNLSEMRF